MDDDSVVLTAANLRALAHPLRVRVLGLLRTYGPATATTLAARLDLTSGALSYHLRQLARFGFIVEDPTRGNRRDRWWRAAHRQTVYEGLAEDSGPEDVVAGEVYEDSVAAGATAALTRARAARSSFTPDWQRVFAMSDYLLQLTPAEAEALTADLARLVAGYRTHDPDHDPAPGTRLVAAQFQVFPVPEPDRTLP